ncbi:mannitol-1-phosphate 5-dehydrogenase [Escherichia albertii]|nr:mannitol-1-phosphate 5-dehydrogenase [Escherichia albertii]
MPDATLTRLIRPTNYKSHSFRRADKAFSPHPPFCAQCLMRR